MQNTKCKIQNAKYNANGERMSCQESQTQSAEHVVTRLSTIEIAATKYIIITIIMMTDHYHHQHIVFIDIISTSKITVFFIIVMARAATFTSIIFEIA